MKKTMKAQKGATVSKKPVKKKPMPNPNDDYKNMKDPKTGKKGKIGGEGTRPPFTPEERKKMPKVGSTKKAKSGTKVKKAQSGFKIGEPSYSKTTKSGRLYKKTTSSGLPKQNNRIDKREDRIRDRMSEKNERGSVRLAKKIIRRENAGKPTENLKGNNETAVAVRKTNERIQKIRGREDNRAIKNLKSKTGTKMKKAQSGSTLKKAQAGSKGNGMRALPKAVRNKMGYAKKGKTVMKAGYGKMTKKAKMGCSTKRK